MKEDLMDELYGDLDDHPSGMHHDEDSVDIYSGLENSPNGDRNKCKVNHLLSPRTIESMDIYEDIIREEEEEKEATYNELKQKFEAAQIQVKELLSKLQILQTKNSSLNNENMLLKKNICSLIKTARMEIVRKDQEISRLSNRSSRGSCGQNFCRPQMESGRANRRHSFNNASCSVLENRDCRQDKITNEVNKHKGNSALGQATASAETPQPSEGLQRCRRNDLENQLKHQNKTSATKSDSETVQSEQHAHNDRTSGSVKHQTTSKVADVSDFPKTCSAGLATSNSEGNKNCLLKQVDTLEKPQAHTSHDKESNLQDKDASQKSLRRVEDDSHKSERNKRKFIKDKSLSRETTNHLSQVPVILRSSERPKSPSFLSHISLPFEVCSQSSKVSLKTVADLETQEHHEDTDSTGKGTQPTGWRSTTCSVMDEASHTQNNKIEKRDASGQQKKDEKRQGVTCSSERRSTRAERHREHEKKRPKESGRSKEDESHSRSREIKSNRSDSSKKYEQRNAKEVDKDNKWCRELMNQGRIDEPFLSSKKSHSHDNFRKMKGFRSPDKNASFNKHCAREQDKHKARGRKRGGHFEEHMVQKNGKSKKIVLNNNDQKDSYFKKHRLKEGEKCKNHQNKHLKSVYIESIPMAADGSNPCKTTKDNSPDRKLSFMETLNLTLSPLKKQKSPSDPHKPVGETSKDISANDMVISELGEEFFVIDELQNSQQSAEEIDEDPELTTAVKKHYHTKTSKQSEQVDYLFTVVTSKKSLSEEMDMKVQKENVTEIQEGVAVNTTPDMKTDKIPSIGALHKESLSQLNHSGIQNDLKTESQDLPPAQNGICQENVSSSDKACSFPKSNFETSVSMEVSSSTITIDLDKQSNAEVGISQDNGRSSHTFENLKHVEMSQTSENLKMSANSYQSLSWGRNTMVPRDSTIVREKMMSSVQASFSEPDSTEKDEQNMELSNSDVFCQDEDSMMLTLRNIRIIPEAISPLTSPVRQVKKVQPHCSDKQPHVKSLSKDLSAMMSDKMNMDMNKENKSPDSSVTSASKKGTKDTVSSSETKEEELEDGEIVSDSEEEGLLFIQTPPREKDKSVSGTHTSPKLSSVAKRLPQRKSAVPVKYSKQSKNCVTTASNGSPTSNKRRFKTVSLPLKAAIYTSDEFMDMLATIRVELRRKYMKLHKNVTKTAFCCIVDMSQASFTEFVNSVDLDKLCNKGYNIKVKLNKIISSIMSKVTKNGIVNRIFDQKAEDLKQKLWTFMDGQINFLFKELKAALKNSSELAMNACSAKNKNVTLKDKMIESEVVDKETFRTSVHRAKIAKVDTGSCVKKGLPNNLPLRGLGSRGKNIKAVMQEDDEQTKVITSHQIPTSSSEKSVHKSTSESENKISYVCRLSSSGSIPDKSDFDILTEQQASSLTFNLASDSQMGEIFKCLLQGSDLLESNLPVGDNQCWPVSTPRKEGLPGERLIGIMTPNKATPSKFITSWSSVSPYKFASNSKKIDPAILDESCLLEVPSCSEPCHVLMQSTGSSQRSFSILAEDLAVSLTVPSPLKSDSHLSFLHPGTGQPLSAPNSILSAHYSDDALDGEDATEQDIHLSLDTDNSSCGSSPSRIREDSDPSGFQFDPNLPMQALVMERSNDHFIVRIRHTSTGPCESDQNEEQAEPKTAAELIFASEQEPSLNPNLTTSSKDLGPAPTEILGKNLAKSFHILDQEGKDAQPSIQTSQSKNVCEISSLSLSSNKAEQVCKDANITLLKESTSARKRKKHHSEAKSKHFKIEKSQGKRHKTRHKRRSKSSKEKRSKPEASRVSPSSLSAKNVIRKKGEVVVTWTRDEDRDILVDLKMKGASPKTFAALSKRLKKSTEQIEERFTQLLKLFKKKEKMDT